MKIISERPTRSGRRVIIDLRPDEELLVIRSNTHYKLGGQMDDIVSSHTLTESHEVFWNQFEQKWSEA